MAHRGSPVHHRRTGEPLFPNQGVPSPAVAPTRNLSRPTAATRPAWTFLSNHGHVLLGIAADPNVRLRDLAERVGITHRGVQLILADLEQAGYVVKTKIGRRNHYAVLPNKPLRHPAERTHTVDELLAIFK